MTVLRNILKYFSSNPQVYDWVVAGCGGDSSRVVVWGHSLGTGVAGHLVSLLCLEANNPAGLVLESPFNNIADEVRNHPMCWVWSKMPWFDWFFTECLADNDVGFVTDQRLAVIDCPVLILHAEDDAVVPYKLGLALYESAQQVNISQQQQKIFSKILIKNICSPGRRTGGSSSSKATRRISATLTSTFVGTLTSQR